MAVEKLSERDASPSDYRKKVGADYLLDGSVARSGGRIQLKVSLVRTKDASEVWSDRITTKLDDVFALQQRIAGEVEGRIRGRVAPGRGARPENIATTGEVYALYAEAQAMFRKRDSESAHAAIALLKRAVAIDPSYAPAWALLGQISGMGISRTVDASWAKQQRDAVAYLQRALQLAPNLAHAHAALAMVQDFPPELEGELRKALELDPSDVEAWGWLGNYLQSQSRFEEALAARQRALAIEPLWYWTSANLIGTLADMKNWAAIDSEIARVTRVGDPVMLAKVEAVAAAVRNQPARQLAILLKLRSEHPEEASYVDNRVFFPLMQLDFVEEAVAAWHMPPEVALDYRGRAPPADVIKRKLPSPLDVWTDGDDALAVWGRSMPRQGRLQEYVRFYDAAFKTPADLFKLWQQKPGLLVDTAPTLAVNLRLAGRTAEADAILDRAEGLVRERLRDAQPSMGALAALAYLSAARGRSDAAVGYLRRAFAEGWLPDRMFQAGDIADEPAFAGLVGRQDFQAIRRAVLNRLAVERSKVPLTQLAAAYPSARKAAAA